VGRKNWVQLTAATVKSSEFRALESPVASPPAAPGKWALVNHWPLEAESAADVVLSLMV